MLLLSMADSDLPFRIEQWDAADQRVERLIAASDSLIVARAAFVAAPAEYPKARLTLRQQTRIIESHPKE
jgi:hypothetical protein